MQLMKRTLLFALVSCFYPPTVSADWFVSGASANSVIRYADDGTNLGNFVAPGSGGLGTISLTHVPHAGMETAQGVVTSTPA